MIIVLGGGIRREMAAAQLAQIHPSLPVIISSGSILVSTGFLLKKRESIGGELPLTFELWIR